MRLDNCDSIRPNLGALVDGELPGRERLRVTAHLEGCEDCAAEADTLRDLGFQLRSAAASQPAIPLMNGLASGVIGRVRAERAQSWGAMFERAVGDWHWVVVGAGSILATTITTSVVWLLLWFGPAPARQDSLASLINNLTTSSGNMFVVVSPAADDRQVVLMQLTNGGSSRGEALSMQPYERQLVDALTDAMERNGWRMQLHAMKATERLYLESLLDDLSRLRMPEATSFGQQLTVRQVHLVTESSVTAKGL